MKQELTFKINHLITPFNDEGQPGTIKGNAPWKVKRLRGGLATWFKSISLVLFMLTVYTSFAQQPATIFIETKDNALVLKTDNENRLGIIHFGRKLLNNAEYAGIDQQYNLKDDGNAVINNNVYTPAGTWSIVEPAIQVTHSDNNNSLELKYISSETKKIDDNTALTSVLLKDPVYPVEVTLFFKTWYRENVIEQWSEIKHHEKKNIILKKFASANLYFLNNKYFLTHYYGGWGREMKPEETELTSGIKTLDSKLGTRADLFEPPTFSVSFDRPATEDAGNVMLGTLAWSGNYKIDFEKDVYGHLRLIAGINNFASEYTLKPGETFTTPGFIYTYSQNGKGEASRNLHSWARKYRILDGEGSRLTLLNNWEATYFDFNENKLTGLFNDAKKLGVDLFLLDDGWFANKYPRNNDDAGLGDWQENRKKLPQGIGYLVKEAGNAGVKFGIWVEPEMVNPKSELYEKHIDWVLREPQRPEHYYRNQLVLDLSNPDVQNFVFGILDTLFTKNPELAFIKWDCNSVIFNAHSMYLEKQQLPQSQLYVDYVRGLYKVLERLRAKYPKVPMMLCSGGGGRVDYGALKYFTEFWPSDNTDPLERVFIQWNYSYFYPAITSCNHVTDWSKAPLKYRTDVAMMGKLGFDIVVSNLSQTDLQFAAQSVTTFKSFSDVVWHGDLYRLVSPYEKNLASLMFVNENKTKSIMFNYLTNNRFQFTATVEPVKMKGLDATKKYTVKELNLYPGIQSTIRSGVFSGDYLMTVGFNPDVNLRRSSVILEVSEVK